MKRFARVFSHLALACITLAVAVWVQMAPVVPPVQPTLTGAVERIVVNKTARQMHLYQGGVIVRSFDIGLGFSPKGDKHRQGDGRTPEGIFKIDRRNDRSAYHLSLGINYPRRQDVIRAAAAGYDPGGDIFIHGQPNALPDATKLRGDWTAGCIALTNAEMREIWDHIPIGTVVEILP